MGLCCWQPRTRHKPGICIRSIYFQPEKAKVTLQRAAARPICPLIYLNTTANSDGLEGEEQNTWIWKAPTCFGHPRSDAHILQHELKLSDTTIISALPYCGKLDNWKSMITRSLMKHLQNILRITDIITEVVIKCERILDKYLLLPNLGEDNLKWAWCSLMPIRESICQKSKGEGSWKTEKERRLRQTHFTFQHSYVSWLVGLASTHTERTTGHPRQTSVL